jgi:hypothetical protein
MAGPKRQPTETRLAAYLVKGDDECWGWRGPTNGKGPTIGRGGKGAGQMSARLLAYRLALGNESTCEVVTSCRVIACLNPRHLALREKTPLLALHRRFDAKVRCGADDECWP